MSTQTQTPVEEYERAIAIRDAEIARLQAALRCRARQRIAAQAEVYSLRLALGLHAEPVCCDPNPE